MAEPSPDFNASEFRGVIKQTMRMGMPADSEEQLVWHINRVQTFSPQDPAIKPYDWSAPPVVDQPGDPDHPEGLVSVDYALEFAASGGGESEVGRFDQSRLEVTVLDMDYEQIKNADYAMIGRVYYEINFVAPPIGLFDVTVYTIFLRARDQS